MGFLSQCFYLSHSLTQSMSNEMRKKFTLICRTSSNVLFWNVNGFARTFSTDVYTLYIDLANNNGVQARESEPVNEYGIHGNISNNH